MTKWNKPRSGFERRARSRETRAAILAAAERVFATAGLAGARTKAIAAEAGVNKALLYYYFRSKEQLYQTAVEEHFLEFNQQALAVLGRSGSPQELLLEYVGLHFDFISRHHRYAPLFHQLLTAGGKVSQRVVGKYFAPRSMAFGQLLARGMKEGDFRRQDQFHLAISIVALIIFYFSAAPVLRLLGHSDAYSERNLKRRRQEVLQFIKRSVFSDRKSSTL